MSEQGHRRAFDLTRIDATLDEAEPSRRFDFSRPVPRDLIVECIAEAVETTPFGRADRWRWVIVDDAALREQLAALHRRDDPDELDSIVGAAPVLVIPCQLGRPEPASEQRALSAFYCDIVPVIAAFTTIARDRGLATAWTTRHLAREADAAALLGIPRNATQIALIPLGFGADQVHTGRNPVSFDARTAFVNRWAG